MSTFVICTEAKKRTQLLNYLTISGVKQTCIGVLFLQEIVYRTRGQLYPVRSTHLLSPGHHMALVLVPQVMKIQRDDEQKKL